MGWDRESYLTMNVEGFLLHIEDELLTVLHLELDILDEDLFQEMEMLILELRPYVKFQKSHLFSINPVSTLRLAPEAMK